MEYNDILLKEKISTLSVAQRVLAIHPISGEIKIGSILTLEGNEFDIRFDNPELGTMIIKDYNIIPIEDSIFRIVHRA